MSKILFEGVSLDDFFEMIREVVRVEIQNSGQELSVKGKDHLLTREQTCTQLHITLPTFHRWAKQGKLRIHKAGGRTLVKKADVEACLKEVVAQKAHVPPLSQSLIGICPRGLQQTRKGHNDIPLLKAEGIHLRNQFIMHFNQY